MDALFERYYRPLVVFAESYLHDLQSAEDLVQEQMVKLWSKQTFAGIVPEALGTFLFTVVKNACINWLEKKRLPVKSLNLLHYQIALEEAERLDDSAVELIRGALEKLPDKTRLVVTVVMLVQIAGILPCRSGAMTMVHFAPAAVSGCPPWAPVIIPSEPTTTLQLKFTSTSRDARITKSSLLT